MRRHSSTLHMFPPSTPQNLYVYQNFVLTLYIPSFILNVPSIPDNSRKFPGIFHRFLGNFRNSSMDFSEISGKFSINFSEICIYIQENFPEISISFWKYLGNPRDISRKISRNFLLPHSSPSRQPIVTVY